MRSWIMAIFFQPRVFPFGPLPDLLRDGRNLLLAPSSEKSQRRCAALRLTGTQLVVLVPQHRTLPLQGSDETAALFSFLVSPFDQAVEVLRQSIIVGRFPLRRCQRTEQAVFAPMGMTVRALGIAHRRSPRIQRRTS